jgi:hypothetical protein
MVVVVVVVVEMVRLGAVQQRLHQRLVSPLLQVLVELDPHLLHHFHHFLLMEEGGVEEGIILGYILVLVVVVERMGVEVVERMGPELPELQTLVVAEVVVLWTTVMNPVHFMLEAVVVPDYVCLLG